MWKLAAVGSDGRFALGGRPGGGGRGPNQPPSPSPSLSLPSQDQQLAKARHIASVSIPSSPLGTRAPSSHRNLHGTTPHTHTHSLSLSLSLSLPRTDELFHSRQSCGHGEGKGRDGYLDR
ncbi:hypothetical protein LX36DRAFT_283315 [Colletotrichum falcatum]|nr:hypothetical protein LX36DRAFT_283315 [Colletotrichum falcatum]